MLIFEYWCGQLERMFTDRDMADVDQMCWRLDNPNIADAWDYKTEDGEAILFWRKNGKIHGNIFGHDESIIPESNIANGRKE